MRAKLEWAVGPDGRNVRAASFVGVDPRDRPRVTCPCCVEVVAIKAGDVVVPHIAHLPGSACAATNPETAAHLNAKMRLVALLGRTHSMEIAGRCRYGHTAACVWSPTAWARAVPEYTHGSRRPDVALLDGAGAVLAALEVLHTHAVDRRKAADLAALGAPWIEVTSGEALEWDGVRPLALNNCDAATRGEINAACTSCPKPFAFSPEETARRAEFAAWSAEAEKRTLPTLNIAAAHARCQRWGGVEVGAVGAKVCLPGAAVRVDFADEITRSLEGHIYAVRHALRLLARSEKVRPAAIWIAGEHDGVDSISAPPHLWIGGFTVPDDAKAEVVELLARTGSVVVRATRRSPHRIAVDGVQYHTRSHAESGELRGKQ